jgi:A/G-specific adenine glycosylase
MSLITPPAAFSGKLLSWSRYNSRNFPWRKTRDPYHILVVEILLHRTRADQVVPVYAEFVKKFPDLKSLAGASEGEVRKMLQPLGLHWRVTLLFSMVNEITDRFKGKIPEDKNELESLPGISHYIASAVRSFGHGLPDPILDTNTVRIISRIFGITVTDSSRRSRKFMDLYLSLMDKERPREFNFAMIDLAALLCKPANPICHQCPVIEMCAHGKLSLNRK